MFFILYTRDSNRHNVHTAFDFATVNSDSFQSALKDLVWISYGEKIHSWAYEPPSDSDVYSWNGTKWVANKEG
jgi:hypothetical protein